MKFFKKKISVNIPYTFPEPGQWDVENAQALEMFRTSGTGKKLMQHLYEQIMNLSFSTDSSDRERDGIRKGMIMVCQQIIVLSANGESELDSTQ